MVQLFGQLMWLPATLFARWMEVLASAVGALSSPCPADCGETTTWSATAPGTRGPDGGTYRNNPGAHGDGAAKTTKEVKHMSDCRCCDEHGTVKLVQYSIVTIKRCEERILYQSEIIETKKMSPKAFATWVVALYLQSEGCHIPHDDKKFLRVYHRVLDEWPRQKNCCKDQKVDALHEIRRAIEELVPRLGSGPEPAASAS